MRPKLDIIIPARGEHSSIGRCLASILAAARDLDLQVVVVANGPESNLTLGAAAPYEESFTESKCVLVALCCDQPNKPSALNLGDSARRECPVVYLDADVCLDPSALVAMAVALKEDAPRLVAPRLRVGRAKDWIGRRFSAVWTALPAVADDVVGAGCYGVNLAGRARWGSFPTIVADDAYVRSRFARAERLILPGVTFEIQMPPWTQLPVSMRRWRDGNRQLRSMPARDGRSRGSDPSASLWENACWAISRPTLWPSLLVYLGLWFASHLAPRSVVDAGWSPRRESSPGG